MASNTKVSITLKGVKTYMDRRIQEDPIHEGESVLVDAALYDELRKLHHKKGDTRVFYFVKTSDARGKEAEDAEEQAAMDAARIEAEADAGGQEGQDAGSGADGEEGADKQTAPRRRSSAK